MTAIRRQRALILTGTTGALCLALFGVTSAPSALALPPSVNGPSSNQTSADSDYRVTVASRGIATSGSKPKFIVTTAGFDSGNWINLWYRQVDPNTHRPVGIQNDWGGAFSDGDTMTVTATHTLPAGEYIVQASVGSWPNETWSPALPTSIDQAAKFAAAATVLADGTRTVNAELTDSGYTQGTLAILQVLIDGKWQDAYSRPVNEEGAVAFTSADSPLLRNSTPDARDFTVRVSMPSYGPVPAYASPAEHVSTAPLTTSISIPGVVDYGTAGFTVSGTSSGYLPGTAVTISLNGHVFTCTTGKGGQWSMWVSRDDYHLGELTVEAQTAGSGGMSTHASATTTVHFFVGQPAS